MPYNITLTNGTVIGQVADTQVNASLTSIGLPGRASINWGQVIDTNLVHLMENFSNSVSPALPLAGQLWWDSTNQLLKLYNGTDWTTNIIATEAWTLSQLNNITHSGIVAAGSYEKVTVNSFGIVTAGANLSSADIVTALGYTPVNKAGDTMSGALDNTQNIVAFGSEVISVSGVEPGNFRTVSGSYGAFFKNDSAEFYLMLTAAGDPYGTWTPSRPLTVALATGNVTLCGNGELLVVGGPTNINGATSFFASNGGSVIIDSSKGASPQGTVADGQIIINAPTGNNATIDFNINQVVTTSLGLDPSGYFQIGGGSWARDVWKIDASGNTTQLGTINVPTVQANNVEVASYFSSNLNYTDHWAYNSNGVGFLIQNQNISGNGQIAFYVANSGSAGTTAILAQPLIVQGTNVVVNGNASINTGVSNTTNLGFGVTAPVGGVYTVPSASAGAYNGLTSTGDQLIFASNGSVGTGNLVLGNWSSGSNGIRISASGSHVVGGNLSVSNGMGVANGLVVSGGLSSDTVTSSGSMVSTGPLYANNQAYVTAPNLATSVGSRQYFLHLGSGDANVDHIAFQTYRQNNGSDWTTASQYINRAVDSVGHGYLRFGDGGGTGDTSFTAIGSLSSGNPTDFVTVNASAFVCNVSGSFTNTLYVTGSTVATTAGSEQVFLRVGDPSYTDRLSFIQRRMSTGSDDTTISHFLQHRAGGLNESYIRFGSGQSGDPSSISLGYYASSGTVMTDLIAMNSTAMIVSVGAQFPLVNCTGQIACNTLVPYSTSVVSGTISNSQVSSYSPFGLAMNVWNAPQGNGQPWTFTIGTDCPATVKSVWIRLWGAGGGAGGVPSGQTSVGGPGGGAGEYRETMIACTTGDVFSIVIGAAGAGGAFNSTYNNGSNGTSSSISKNGTGVMTAGYGIGGAWGSGFSQGGGSSIGSGGAAAILGGFGGDGYVNSSPYPGYGGAPAMGSSVRGAATTTVSGQAGFNGQWPGGGGAGKYLSDGAGGNGANGGCIIMY